MENITTETLKQIYAAAREFCIAAKGFDPSTLELDDDGTIFCNYNDRDGDTQESCRVTAANLTADLVEAAENRRIAVEKERERKRVLQAELDAAWARKEKLQRQRQYLELKKEFEPTDNNQ